MVTFGIEEEFLLIDPLSGMPAARAAELSGKLAETSALVTTASAEFLASQLETSTIVCESLEQAADALLLSRAHIAEAASASGVGVALTGAAPLIPEPPAEITQSGRYLLMGEVTGAVAGEHYLNGTHIHVGIPDREDRVAALNRIRPWLATLAALSANSPFWRGRDSSFSSWRLIHYRRWSVQGCPPYFADAADYDRRLEHLLATDVVLDAGHIGWAARLSQQYPTLEVRVGDAQLEAQDSVLLAALVRGLVTTVLREPEASPTDPEMHDAALWQAARYGLDAHLMGLDGVSSPAQAQLDTLLAYIRPALEDAGDLPYVVHGLERLHRTGTGAARQRAAVAQAGWSGLTDLFRRSLAAA
ncbi:glutamate--cysteine ligase [Arthrobacter sp. Sa2CUA1]|uniref:Putative glutamate--cysteine ligase 2 n=1 Tax=Arthrobacter gallicola TaxID=2762225 RepID=A0ABR8US91_9MICC|nr:glutamate--cysteine ligase [Arthrobacter gallicola]MBD7995426.1 glutamate--cysteine ligase [Arthrobacter gallicola]